MSFFVDLKKYYKTLLRFVGGKRIGREGDHADMAGTLSNKALF